jgi:hypothetical protein
MVIHFVLYSNKVNMWQPTNKDIIHEIWLTAAVQYNENHIGFVNWIFCFYGTNEWKWVWKFCDKKYEGKLKK